MKLEEQVQEVIKIFNLHEKSGKSFTRREDILYPRYYLINHLRNDLLLTTIKIAEMLKIHHASVIHACRQVEIFEEINDKNYKNLTYNIAEFIKLNPFNHQKIFIKHNLYDIINRVMSIETMEEVETLKQYIKNGEQIS